MEDKISNQKAKEQIVKRLSDSVKEQMSKDNPYDFEGQLVKLTVEKLQRGKK